MSKENNKFKSLQDLGKHFGIEPPKPEPEKNYSNKIPFLGREKELAHLREFIEDPNSNIFGLYGVPMIGKSLLVRHFIKNDNVVRPYTKLPAKFTNPENPELTLSKFITGDKNISDLSFDKSTLIILENFEECLEWKGSKQQQHNIRERFPKISAFLKKIYQLPNVKLIIQSHFQLNTPALGIELTTLPKPKIELRGVDTSYFKKLYLKAGVTEEEFDIICTNFSHHTWLLSKAYQEMSYLYRHGLNKSVSHPKRVTSYLWDLLKEIIPKLRKSDSLLLCALTLKSPISSNDFEQIFEKHPHFKNIMVFESLDSLEWKFLIQEENDNYEINPYLREICFTFMERIQKREIEYLKTLPYFATIQTPNYSFAKQMLEQGNYGGFYKEIHWLQRNKMYDEAHELLDYAHKTDLIINRKGVFNEIGITFKKQGNYPKAIQVFKDLTKEEHVPAFNELAIIYREQKRYPEAILLLEESLTLMEDNVHNLNELAMTYKEQGNISRAVEILEQAAEKGNIHSSNELAMIYRELREYTKAISVLKRSLDISPDDVKSLNELAKTYKEQGNLTEAMNTVEIGLKLAPHDQYFKRTKSRILAAQKELIAPKNPKRKLKNLLSDDRLNKFLKLYINIAKTAGREELHQALLVQSSKFSEIGNLRNTKAISFEEYNQSRIEIRIALHGLFNQFDLPATTTQPAKPGTTKAKGSKKTLDTPLEILMLTSNPAETTRLSLSDEHSKIAEKLEKASGFSLVVKRAINSTELKEKTESIKPAILHFSGHGEKRDEELSQLGIDTSGIVLQNENKNGFEVISPAKLEALFEYLKDNVDLELVILNCCYSEIQAAAIAQYVPYVIGTSGAIKHKNAISFSVGFYFKFVLEKDILQAFKSGRTQAVLNDAKKEDFIIFKDGQKQDL